MKIQDLVFDTLEKIKIENFRKFSHTLKSIKPFIISYIYKKLNSKIMFVVDNNETARDLKSIMEEFDIPVFTLLWFDVLPYESERPSFGVIRERVNFLYNFFSNKNGIYIVPVQSLVFPISDDFLKLLINVKTNDEIGRDELIKKLVNIGYERGNIEYPGQFDVKGDVVTVYTPNNIVRLLFFDNVIEKLTI